jgi:alanyl-tRNA synthetase
MTSSEIRQSFLDFFKSKGHTLVPSSSLMPDSPNLLFTNAGMNQFVPIFLGQTKCPYTPGRAADTQQCIRAGGKHNDLEDVGLDTYHHTFFEMLGNWSFGDYFKKEAIEWAWELVVEKWKFPAKRLYATVYKPGPGEPSEFDQEAYDHWARLFTTAKLDPKVHVRFGGQKDNFWMMGETGPCGPCSELHVDLTSAGETKGSLVNQGDARCIEIWNLVFIQFNANPDGTFSPLPARHVDTGMGFERVTSIIQGTKGLTDFANAKISNYETDIFRPIFDALEKLSGKKYRSTLPGSARLQPTSTSAAIPASESEPMRSGLKARAPSEEQIALDIAFRVIADHIRTLSFAIADGIQPGNTDRNYVLRRILRRAVRYSRTLGFHEPFFYKLVGVLAETMGDVFPEIRAKKKHVQEVIRIEEEAFNKTLDNGTRIFDMACARLVAASLGQINAAWSVDFDQTFDLVEIVDHHDWQAVTRYAREKRSSWAVAEVPPISAKSAFQLYDTYGFPLDLTELMARERGLTVDKEGVEELMEKQRARARAAQRKEFILVSDISADIRTEFVGYDALECEANLLSLTGKEGKQAFVVDRSPFYAEMGGQVGDTGWVEVWEETLKVLNTTKVGSAFLLNVEKYFPANVGLSAKLAGFEFREPLPVKLRVDRVRRNAIQRHHTVTHLLHWALHEVVSKDASQKGSFVGPDKLTFDFNSAPLTPQQVADIEKLVNERILENVGVSWSEAPFADVKSRKDVMQFFGEKYGDTVRIVQIGGRAGELNGYSMELCGGTHTRATGEIGLFRIVGENAIAAGVRRIEAVAGLEAYSRATDELALIKSIAGKVNSPMGELEKKIEALLAQQKELEKQLKSAQQQRASGYAAEVMKQVQKIQEVPTIVANCTSAGFGTGDDLQEIVNALKSKFNGLVILGGASGGSVSLVASVSPEFTAKVQAGKIIQQIAPVVGGKGGGKPDNARGGGKDVSKLDEALAKAKALLG